MPFHVEKAKNYCNFLFILSSTASLISMFSDFINILMNKVKKNASFCELFSIIFQRSKTFQRLFSPLCKSIIMEIINMQMRHYLHNNKGYRALPYTKLKLMMCAFQPYVTHSAKKDIMLQNFKIEFYI